MAEYLKSKTKNKRTRVASHNTGNHLFGKVVLLVGNDTVVLPTVITQLSQRGADIALVCPQWSSEMVRRVKESVEALGRRFLLINVDSLEVPTDRLIQTIISSLGQLDIFIDLSAQKRDPPQAANGNGNHAEWPQPNWKLMCPALQEIAKSY